jgi:Mn-dependent DtxR family transcriptional regulator
VAQGHSVDEYLETIYFLAFPIGEYRPLNAGSPTLAARVAEMLGVSRASAGEMLKRLEAEGLIERGEHKEALLTASGRERAERVVRKHRIIERLLTDFMGYSAAEAHIHADELGDTFNDEMVERIAAKLGNPERCPHGWPVDPDFEQAENDELVALAELDDLNDDVRHGHDRVNDWLLILALPAIVARLALVTLKVIVFGMVVSPAMALLWRRRRLLADATAVELTRDPDALIEALEHLRTHGASVPAGPWSHLFVVGPELEKNRRQRRYEEQYEAAAQDGRRPGESQLAAFARRHRARRVARGEYMQAAAQSDPRHRKASLSTDIDLVAFLPSIETRIRRLTALGGTGAGAPRRYRMWQGLLPIEIVVYGGLFLLLGPLLAVLLILLLALVLVLAMLTAAMELAVLSPAVFLVYALARS